MAALTSLTRRDGCTDVTHSPGEMAELAVGGAGDDLTVDGAELLHALAVRNDLSGAHKRAANAQNNRFFYKSFHVTHMYNTYYKMRPCRS